MPEPIQTTRRDMLITTAAASAASMIAGAHAHAETQRASAPDGQSRVVHSGRINHSVCLWCYKGMNAADMAPVAGRLGLKAIDLVTPKDFDVLKEHGLIGSMTSGVWGGITKGLNRADHHDEIAKSLSELCDATAAAGFPNVICFSGNRDGQADEEGLKVCAQGIKEVLKQFEQKKVTLCMELLNSKVNHPDYQCDHTQWGVDLCKAVGSERFRLLYDIYHMQIMEGDIIATIRKNHEYFAHYHTGGVPGRHEIDESQELYWPAIMKAIVDTGFQGYVAQEFVPAKKDMIASLAQAVQICDV